MTTDNPYHMPNVETLLAHSLMLETEAAERYREVADAMDVHNNPEVAELFRQLAGYADLHAKEMEERAQGLVIPHVAPWDFVWGDEDSPEAASPFETHYKMTPYHVIQLALNVERNACNFYGRIAKESTDPKVVALAQEFSDEEQEHVQILESWETRYPIPDKNWDDDLDPPMMHE